MVSRNFLAFDALAQLSWDSSDLFLMIQWALWVFEKKTRGQSAVLITASHRGHCLATPSLPPLKSSISHSSMRAWLLFRPSQGSGLGSRGRGPTPAGLATTLAACLRVGGCVRQVSAPPAALHPLLSSLGPGRPTTHCLAPTSPAQVTLPSSLCQSFLPTPGRDHVHGLAKLFFLSLRQPGLGVGRSSHKT